MGVWKLNKNMKKVLIIIAIAIISSCCKNEVRSTYPVVEKFHTQDRDGINVYYQLLLKDGTEVDVNSSEYAKAKIGDLYYVRECQD